MGIAMNNASPVLECQQVSKHYGQGALAVNVLSNVNLRILPGERVAIVGASGSGKSTLLNILGGLDVPDSGEVRVANQHLSRLSADERGRLRNRSLGFVYQFHHLLPEFTALENVSMPLLIGRHSIAESKARALALLTRVGLAKRVNHKPSELSGGERQRVAIARALVTNPACVLMDEPTGNLDKANSMNVFDIFKRLAAENHQTIIAVTHDPDFAAGSDRIMEMEDGKILGISKAGALSAH